MSSKRIVLLVLLILNCLIIFMFSNQNGRKSTSISDKVTSHIVDSYSDLTNQKLSDSEKKLIIDYIKPLIRKSAHFLIYLTLGMISYLLALSFDIKHPIAAALLFSILYAMSDELHQLFITERSASIFDILIDAIGSLTGMMFIMFIKKMLRYSRYKSGILE